jgi:MFS family permease
MAPFPGKSPAGRGRLNCLNFFIADLQAGVGPFLGIFLIERGWQTSMIGTVMTIGGIAGIMMTTPAGALVDATNKKRLFVVLPGVCTILASAIILFSQQFWVVAASQVATAIAGAAIGPAIIGITLGMVHQEGFPRQNAVNQAYNHAGNMVGAILSGYMGMRYGMPAIFLLAALFGVLSIIFVLLIPAKSINDRIARGLSSDKNVNENIGGFSLLMKNRQLLTLAACLAFFHLGNGAMLPLYGLAAASKKAGDPSMFVAMTVAVAQLVMVFASIVAMKAAKSNGYWIVMLVSFIALPIRGLIAAYFINKAGLYPVQILDGIGAGLQSVAVPGLVAQMLNGSGRLNAGQGVIMTVQGLGAALSPALGGWLVHFTGYNSTFLLLGSFAIVSIILWTSGYKSLQESCQPAC